MSIDKKSAGVWLPIVLLLLLLVQPDGVFLNLPPRNYRGRSQHFPFFITFVSLHGGGQAEKIQQVQHGSCRHRLGA